MTEPLPFGQLPDGEKPYMAFDQATWEREMELQADAALINDELRTRAEKAEHWVERIRDIWRNAGINPQYHEQEKRRMNRWWPLLYAALDDLDRGIVRPRKREQ